MRVLTRSSPKLTAVLHYSIGIVLQQSAVFDRGFEHVLDLQGGLEVGNSRLWEGRHTTLRTAESQGVEKHITGQ